jgi:hypothetical protein
MTRLRFTLAQLLAILLYLGFGFAALRNADEFWASAAYTLAIILIAAALVGALARKGGARTTWIGFGAERTYSASPVASRCVDGSDKPELRLASRFELSDAVSALRLPPKAVATVSGPTVRHPEIVTRLQRMSLLLHGLVRSGE